jgi:nucleoside triphosphate pyrophosphatase
LTRPKAPGVELTLASASPQRRAILEMAGIAFEVRPSGVEELSSGDPRGVAAENARRKALAITNPHTPLVLGADTDVALDGDILGKPAGAAQARAFLERLSGRTHEVVGGIALAQDGRVVAEAVVVTPVRFRALDPALIDWYVETGEWRDRAGGYAIQGKGAVLVAGVQGDYFNVVGLPLVSLLELRPELLPTARLQ